MLLLLQKVLVIAELSILALADPDTTVTDFTSCGTIRSNRTLNPIVSSIANNSFTNTGGLLNAIAFALSVDGDFDYVANFNGTSTTNTIMS